MMPVVIRAVKLQRADNQMDAIKGVGKGKIYEWKHSLKFHSFVAWKMQSSAPKEGGCASKSLVLAPKMRCSQQFF